MSRKLPAGVFVTPAFERRSTTYSIPVPDAAFLALLDSESYVTGNAAYKEGADTLLRKLDRETAVASVDYDGHFGAQVIIELDFDDDNPENREAICAVINDHLAWCLTLSINPTVAKCRAEEAAA